MERYKISANDFVFNKQITVGLEQLFDFDRDFDINQIIDEKLKESINPVNDVEIKRFKPSFDSAFSFNFIISGSSTYDILYTDSEILNNYPVFKNSTWIIESFDSPIKSVQKRLSTGFYKPERKYSNKVLNRNINIILNDGLKTYTDKSYSNIFVPRNFFSDGQNIKDVYLRFRFFSAKNGKTYTFRKITLNNEINNDDYFFKIKLDNINNIWYISDQISNFQHYQNNLSQNDENNKQPTMSTDDNKDKGDFINTDGKYQSGADVYNENC